MRSITKALGLCLLVLPAAGCAGNPLVGHWSTTFNNNSGGGTASGTANVALNADGTATGTVGLTQVTVAGVMATCTGTLTYTGLMWSSTATVLTISGPGTCTGSSTCMVGALSYTYDCAMSMSSSNPVGTYNYTLSNNNMLLTVTPTGGGNASTYTRGS